MREIRHAGARRRRRSGRCRGGAGGVRARGRGGARRGHGWLGGQLTTQAVSPDEHPWIERFGCTARYRALRDAIRAYYRRHYPLADAARAHPALGPGASFVSAIAHEPRVALAVVEALLAPHRSSGGLTVLARHALGRALVDGHRVRALTVRSLDGGNERVVWADWVLDATETGALLPLCGAEYVTGFESREDTGEPHAPAAAQPLNMQAVTACFALDHVDGEDHTIDRPSGYDEWRARRPPHFPEGQLSFVVPDPRTNAPAARSFAPNPPGDPAAVGPDLAAPGLDRDLWLFRRIVARGNFAPGAYRSDITLANWPQLDYTGGPVFEVPQEEAAAHRRAARALSLAFVHWLQTEAPRPDGGAGWPGLRLRGDVVGDTADGLAPALYIREARRIRGERTVVEQDVAHEVRGDAGAVRYDDTVGIGQYRIDLHPSTGGDGYVDVACCPFQIPLGALVPVRLDNLLAAGRAIATTQVTNGAYRLHPVEWNIGEAAGELAAFCAEHGTVPRAVRAGAEPLAEFQARLAAAGVELEWPAEARAY